VAVRRVQPEADDARGNAWADPALQQLGEWLVDNGVAQELAESIQESVWAWYSYFVLPAYRQAVPLAIAVKAADRPSVCVLLPAATLPELAVAADRTQLDPMAEAFRLRVADRNAEIIDARLDTLSLRSLAEFDAAVRRWSKSHRLHPLGVFHDNLHQELAALMETKAFDAWLATPNLALAGATPADLLASDNDRPLRDLILSVRHALPLWT
jgi:hypothetical protein